MTLKSYFTNTNLNNFWSVCNEQHPNNEKIILIIPDQ